MNEDQFRKELKRRILTEYGTQRKAAKAWGVYEQRVCDYMHGRRDVPEKVLIAIGYEKSVSYIKI